MYKMEESCDQLIESIAFLNVPLVGIFTVYKILLF